MKLKLDIDILFPAWLKRAALVAVAPAALVAFAAVASADPPATFKDGETLSAAKLNKAFSDLDARLAEAENQVPTGTIAAFGGAKVPAGWLPADGTLLDSAKPEYKALYGVIGVSFGGSATSGMFNLPDLRGRFLRGVDSAQGHDPDAATRVALNPGGNEGDQIGSLQTSAVGPHTHPMRFGGGVALQTGGNQFVGPFVLATPETGLANADGAESRPMNVAVNWIIKL